MTGGSGGGGGDSPQLNPAYSFGVEESTVLATGRNGMTPVFGRGRDVTRARVYVFSAPTGHVLTINFLLINPVDGTTFATITGGDIAIGATYASITLATTTIPEGYMLVPNITAVGSTLPGTGLACMVD